MKKKFVFFVLLVLMLSMCAFSVSAQSGPVVEKVVRISDTGLMVEFSEDVIIDGRNPFLPGVRLLVRNSNLVYVDGSPKQFYNFDFSVIDGSRTACNKANNHDGTQNQPNYSFHFTSPCRLALFLTNKRITIAKMPTKSTTPIPKAIQVIFSLLSL